MKQGLEMSHYEATIRIAHLSTSPKARNPLSVSAAVGKAKANLRYVAREGATADADFFHYSAGTLTSAEAVGRDEVMARGKAAIDARALKHRADVGVRLADKLIISLPADATPAEHREMLKRICERLGSDSEAHIFAAIHRDKRGNPHAHLLAFDGLESQEKARLRAGPGAKRVRRQEYLRLNEGGNRPEVRRRIAAAINGVSRANGRRLAEVRSFATRGIDKQPQRHEGVQVQDKAQRGQLHTLTPAVAARLDENISIMAARLTEEHGEAAAAHMPQRWHYSPALFGKALEAIRGLRPQLRSTTAIQAPSFLAKAKGWLTKARRKDVPSLDLSEVLAAETQRMEARQAAPRPQPQPSPEKPPEAAPAPSQPVKETPFLTLEEEARQKAMEAAHKARLAALTQPQPPALPQPAKAPTKRRIRARALER